jgi:hypothetical protein
MALIASVFGEGMSPIMTEAEGKPWHIVLM